MAVKLWGGFLLLVGIAMIVFNKPYAAKTAGLVPIKFGGTLVPRMMTVVVGLMFVFVGASLLFVRA